MSQLVPHRPQALRSVFGLGRDFERALEGLFDDTYRGMDFAATGAWAPPVDVRHTDESVEVWMDLPGVPKNAVDIRIEGSVLTVAGTREGQHVQERDTWYRSERSFGKFERSFALPTELDATKASAIHRDGVLHITIPRAEKAKPRRLEIKAG